MPPKKGSRGRKGHQAGPKVTKTSANEGGKDLKEPNAMEIDIPKEIIAEKEKSEVDDNANSNADRQSSESPKVMQEKDAESVVENAGFTDAPCSTQDECIEQNDIHAIYDDKEQITKDGVIADNDSVKQADEKGDADENILESAVASDEDPVDKVSEEQSSSSDLGLAERETLPQDKNAVDHVSDEIHSDSQSIPEVEIDKAVIEEDEQDGSKIMISEDECEMEQILEADAVEAENLEDEAMEAELAKGASDGEDEIQYVDEEADEEQHLLDVMSGVESEKDVGESLGGKEEVTCKQSQDNHCSKFEEISEGSIDEAEQEEVFHESFSDVEIIEEPTTTQNTISDDKVPKKTHNSSDAKTPKKTQNSKRAESLEEVFFATENNFKLSSHDKDNDEISDASLSDHENTNMSLEEISDDDVEVSKKKKKQSEPIKPTENTSPQSSLNVFAKESKSESKSSQEKACAESLKSTEIKPVDFKDSPSVKESTETDAALGGSEKQKMSSERPKGQNASAKRTEKKQDSYGYTSKVKDDNLYERSASNRSGIAPQRKHSALLSKQRSAVDCSSQTEPRQMKGKIVQCNINRIKSSRTPVSESRDGSCEKIASAKFLDQFKEKLPYSIPGNVISTIICHQANQDNQYSLGFGPITFADLASGDFRDNLLHKSDHFSITFDEHHHGIYKAIIKRQENIASLVRQLKLLELGNRYLTMSLSYGSTRNMIGVMTLMYDQDIQSRRQHSTKGDAKLRAKLQMNNVPQGISKDFVHLLFPEALSISAGPGFDKKRSMILGFSNTKLAQEIMLCHDLVVMNGQQISISALDYIESVTECNSQGYVETGTEVVIDDTPEGSEGNHALSSAATASTLHDPMGGDDTTTASASSKALPSENEALQNILEAEKTTSIANQETSAGVVNQSVGKQEESEMETSHAETHTSENDTVTLDARNDMEHDPHQICPSLSISGTEQDNEKESLSSANTTTVNSQQVQVSLETASGVESDVHQTYQNPSESIDEQNCETSGLDAEATITSSSQQIQESMEISTSVDSSLHHQDPLKSIEEQSNGTASLRTEDNTATDCQHIQESIETADLEAGLHQETPQIVRGSTSEADDEKGSGNQLIQESIKASNDVESEQVGEGSNERVSLPTDDSAPSGKQTAQESMEVLTGTTTTETEPLPDTAQSSSNTSAKIVSQETKTADGDKEQCMDKPATSEDDDKKDEEKNVATATSLLDTGTAAEHADGTTSPDFTKADNILTSTTTALSSIQPQQVDESFKGSELVESKDDSESGTRNQNDVEKEPVASKSLEDVSDEEMIYQERDEENAGDEVVIMREDSSTKIIANIDLTMEESNGSDAEARSTKSATGDQVRNQSQETRETEKESIPGNSDKKLLMTDEGFEIDMEVIDVTDDEKVEEKIIYARHPPQQSRTLSRSSRGSSHGKVFSRNNENNAASRRSPTGREYSGQDESRYRSESGRPIQTIVPSRESTAQRRDTYRSYARKRSRSPAAQYNKPDWSKDTYPPWQGSYTPVYNRGPYPSQQPVQAYRPPYSAPTQHWRPSYDHSAPYYSNPSQSSSYSYAPIQQPHWQTAHHYQHQQPSHTNQSRGAYNYMPPEQSSQYSRGRDFQIPPYKERRTPPPKSKNRSRSRSLSDMSDDAEPPIKRSNRGVMAKNTSSATRKRVSRSPISVSSCSRSLSPVSCSPSPDRSHRTHTQNEIVKSVKQFLHAARDFHQVKESKGSISKKGPHSKSPSSRHASSSSKHSPKQKFASSPRKRVMHSARNSPPPHRSNRTHSPIQGSLHTSSSRHPNQKSRSSLRHRSPSPVSSESSRGSPPPPPSGRQKNYGRESSSHFRDAQSSSISKHRYGMGLSSKRSREHAPSTSPPLYVGQVDYKGRKSEHSRRHDHPRERRTVTETQSRQHVTQQTFETGVAPPNYMQPNNPAYSYGSPYPAAPSATYSGYNVHPPGPPQPNVTDFPYQQHSNNPGAQPQHVTQGSYGPSVNAPPMPDAYHQAYSLLKTALGELQQQPQHPQNPQHPYPYPHNPPQASVPAQQPMPAASAKTKSWSMGSNAMVFQRVLGNKGDSRKSGNIEVGDRGRHERPKMTKEVRVLTQIPTKKK
ncbi:hypothetical protein PoB_003073200 [Plakobranchus ocellatus]|uniref:Uncharacterized protein n=1 Tax=Plakobranchus ocellatus TaxID=259542 RepID=A0AAV4ABH1_9GAST|nr:hypothetical protein PoB_003073200 [Plakobranchus ocellatus]